ncbi:DUF6197 family protein [Nonomuraea rhodomycinica]|uniref:Uncharacterized protein n=1 Tax=Nonomuraea rhodomycinica TaxID=1712872 RepID=A0A7Y6MF33_9ACTN|nr:hypothetical protein [Nonomuraea rhodomycinica]NUW45587.1 hypothetical protein [Nonomuraea rhodomycinica]
MTADTLDLAISAVLQRAADTIDDWDLCKGDYTDPIDGGFCTAGAIAHACALDASDWQDGHTPVYNDPDENTRWLARRAAALTALRALAGHVLPFTPPEDMSRRELIDLIALWNDDEDRTAEQVVEAMRAAASEVTA